MLKEPRELLTAKQWREGTANSRSVNRLIKRLATKKNVDELQRQWRIQKHTEDHADLQTWLGDDDDDRR